jgi:DNA-binding NarL/FixJ family response regulator
MIVPIPEIKCRIIVADDNAKVLLSLVGALSEEFEVVATATDGHSALNSIQQLQPAVAVLDLNMPGLNGIEVTREITRRQLALGVVICSVESDPELIGAARLAGALGYVLKRRLKKDLVTAVKRAACGQCFISYFETATSQDDFRKIT